MLEFNDHIGNKLLISQRLTSTHTFTNPKNTFSLLRSFSETFIMWFSRRMEDKINLYFHALGPKVLLSSGNQCDPFHTPLVKQMSKSTPLLPVITTNGELISRTMAIPRRLKKPECSVLVQRESPVIRGRRRCIAMAQLFELFLRFAETRSTVLTEPIEVKSAVKQSTTTLVATAVSIIAPCSSSSCWQI